MPSGWGRRPGAGGHDGRGEAEPGGLGQPAGDAGDRADLAGQADLADRDGAPGQRPVGAELAMARATARSAAGSVRRTPPTVET